MAVQARAVRLPSAIGTDGIPRGLCALHDAVIPSFGSRHPSIRRGAPPQAVEIGTLSKSFPGVDDHGGTFRTHLELAALAIALKQRVIVLQAVEHAQIAPGSLFENFTRALKADQQRLDKLESSIAGVLERLSALELARPQGLRPVFTTGEVDRLMRAANRIHRLGDGVMVNSGTTDVAIGIARDKDGSVVVFPALPT